MGVGNEVSYVRLADEVVIVEQLSQLLSQQRWLRIPNHWDNGSTL